MKCAGFVIESAIIVEGADANLKTLQNLMNILERVEMLEGYKDEGYKDGSLPSSIILWILWNISVSKIKLRAKKLNCCEFMAF